MTPDGLEYKESATVKPGRRVVTYFLAAAQWGGHTRGNQTRYSYGHSLVADPWGHVIAKASDGVGVITARLEPEGIAAVRQDIPIARHKVLEG